MQRNIQIKVTKGLATIFLLCFSMLIVAQQKYTISGFINDQQTTESLIGAAVTVPTRNIGVITNNFGFYSISLPKGDYSLQCRYLGYDSKSIFFRLSGDTVINIELQTKLTIDEITVKGKQKQSDRIENIELGTYSLSMETIKRLPVMAGESDVLKTLQFLPGVKQSNEGTAGINVRGGSPDQNLILLDGVPVYNVNHLFGFLSVFNTDAINNVKLYTGGIPARFGGRLSSVLDISMKEGNMKRNSGVFSISPISGRVSIEGPIKKDTSAFIISARRSFLDLPIRAYLLFNQDIQAGYYFYDLNGKANWIINPKNRVYFSSYMGRDEYFIRSKNDKTKSDYSYNWGNYSSVFRWNKIFNSSLFSNVTAYYCNFSNIRETKIKDDETLFEKFKSTLNDWSLQADFDYYPSSNQKIKFGNKFTVQQFMPEAIQAKLTDNEVAFSKNNPTTAFINRLYFEDEIDISRAISINAGLHFSSYQAGKKTYYDWQPRFAMRIKLNDHNSFKASFIKMDQHLHLLTNSSLGLPTDLWVSSTEKIRPQTSFQYSAGIFSRLKDGLDFSVETYYKKMNHVIQFSEGASFGNSDQQNWESKVESGEGEAYGTEFQLSKSAGRLTGMVNYTLSWSNRRFPEINGGRTFPYKYDRRHDLSVLGDFTFTDTKIRKTNLTLGFTYASGNAITVSNSRYQGINFIQYDKGDDFWLGLVQGMKTRTTYDSSNNYRMPSFHHLDIGYHITRIEGRKSWTWSFSAYNIYSRQNPWYYYENKGNLRQVSLFPIIPSVSFTHKW